MNNHVNPGREQAESSAQSDVGREATEDTEMTEDTESDTTAAANSGGNESATEAAMPDQLPEQVRVAGVPIRFENFTTAAEDPTIGPVSFLSYPGEWHAAGVGYVVTVMMTLALALGMEPAAVASLAAGSGVVLRGAFEQFRQSAHVKDALKEPAYAAFGSILGLLPVLGFAVTGKLAAFGGIL